LDVGTTKGNKMNQINIHGTKEDIREIIARLLQKYGKDARLIDVMFKEYGCNEVDLY
jgi:hypothetical protein